MKEGWSQRWKKLLVWVCGYSSIVAFVIVGGYFVVKTDDKELKNTVKSAFIVTLIFTALSMLFSLYNHIGGLVDGYYVSSAYQVYDVMSTLVNIAKIIVYVVMAAIAFFKDSAPVTTNDEKKTDGIEQ